MWSQCFNKYVLRKDWVRRVQEQWQESLRRSSLIKICFKFMPGHVGVKGNERAVWLAGMATGKTDEQWTRLISWMLLGRLVTSWIPVMTMTEIMNRLLSTMSNGVRPNKSAMKGAKDNWSTNIELLSSVAACWGRYCGGNQSTWPMCSEDDLWTNWLTN